MSDWRSFVLRLLRVPPQPTPPPGTPPRVFRASKNYFKLRVVTWIGGSLVMIATASWLAILVLYLLPADAPRHVRMTLIAVEAVVVLTLLLRITFGYAIVRLDYELRWYMISDRAIRIREGIVTVREKTIALANIQNTAVNQGPLQRLLGIADVEVRTAGGGSGSGGGHNGKGGQIGEPMHVGYFRGVDNAQEVRDVIVERARKHRDAGLGDPEDADPSPDAAEDLLREVRALREMLERVTSNP